MKQVGNTILAKGVNHILAKRDNSAWPKGSKLSGFSIGGIIAWKLYNGNQWWKLAGYTLLSTTVLLAIVLFGFVWDWHDTGGRPANIPSDVGTYIKNNELVGIILLLWLIIAPILSCVISYITKRVIR